VCQIGAVEVGHAHVVADALQSGHHTERDRAVATNDERVPVRQRSDPGGSGEVYGSAVDTRAVVENYVRAWHERDEAGRRRLLEASWAADGVYTDPLETIVGRDAVFEAIAAFHKQRPDGRIEVRSRVDEFGRYLRFVWATVDGSGAVQREGVDFGQLDAAGRIASIVGFFGVVP
jgi:hypothetical protein